MHLGRSTVPRRDLKALKRSRPHSAQGLCPAAKATVSSRKKISVQSPGTSRCDAGL
jgi:hypothetical protein